MIKFSDRPIKDKLSAIILLTSAILLLLTSSALVISELLIFRRTMVDDLFVFADLVGMNSTAGLSFNDNISVEENIGVLKANSHIILAHVFTPDGRLFASYFRDKQNIVPLTLSDLQGNDQTEDNYVFHDQFVEIFKKIIFENEMVGTVYIRSDLTELEKRLRLAAYIVVAVLLFALFFGILIASKLQQLITTPIYRLLKTMKMVSAQTNYSLRAHKQGNDEIGTLIDGFNDMLAQIEQYRNNLEEKVKERTTQLAETRDQALAANKAKSIFLANMSHEIRTPMNAVLGYTQILLRDSTLNHGQQDLLHAIEKSGTHLLGLINDILDISKIEAGAMELHPQNFILSDFINELSTMFKMRSEQKKLIWRIENAITKPVLVYADQNKLRQILINLLGNAIKFTEVGEIVLRVSQQATDYYRFEVIDTGIGISADSQKTIFKAFQQNEVGYDKGGTGLGLAITQQQVELMGGTITVKSELGKWSCFTLELPLPAGEGEVPETIAEITHLAPGYQVSALVVDDVKASRYILAEILCDLGIDVRQAANGQDCLDQIHEWPPDIVFMDIRMPVMNGITTIRHIREEFSDKISCIAVTTSTLKQDSDQLLQAGFDDFIGKPYRFDRVYKCLDKYLSVEFEYNKSEQPAETLDLTKLSLPQSLHERLTEAAELSNLTALEALIVELATEQQALATTFKKCLDNYDTDAIVDMLNEVTYE